MTVGSNWVEYSGQVLPLQTKPVDCIMGHSSWSGHIPPNVFGSSSSFGMGICVYVWDTLSSVVVARQATFSVLWGFFEHSLRPVLAELVALLPCRRVPVSRLLGAS